MLAVTPYSGFGSGGNLVQSQIDRTAGTAIGDVTDFGGLAASFDGVTNQAISDCSRTPGTATEAFIGKDWGAGVTRKVNGFKSFSSNNRGFVQGIDPQVTIELQGSSDNFSADINSLGTATTVTDVDSLIITKLTGMDVSVAYRYHRLRIAHDGAPKDMCSAECQFFEGQEL